MDRHVKILSVNGASRLFFGLVFSIFLMAAMTPGDVSADPAECVIKLGHDGKTYTYSKSLTSVGSTAEWAKVSKAAFVRSTSGPCTFTIYNKSNFLGPSVTLGTNLSGRIRAGLDGITKKDSGGGDTWGVRSIKMTRVATDCVLNMGGGGVRMDYYAGRYLTIPECGAVSSFLGGDCQAYAWNAVSFGAGDEDNRFKAFHPSPYRSNAYDPGFRLRSLKIWNQNGTCSPIAKDHGRCLPQTTLGQSIYVLPNADDDRDKDGLMDELENYLATAFRPIYVNHSSENATKVNVYEAVTGAKVIEPVTTYQVEPVTNGEIAIRFMKIWREDKGVAILCAGHAGDTQLNTIYLKTQGTPSSAEYGRFWYVYKTGGGVEGDLAWEKGDGSIRGVHFEKWEGESAPTANHLVIYFSKGKHHEYGDAGWSGQADKECSLVTAHINSRGEQHDPPLPKRLAVIRSPAGKGDRFNYNNVGNKAHHDGFLDDLGPLGYAGQRFWSGENFYSDAATPPCKNFK